MGKLLARTRGIRGESKAGQTELQTAEYSVTKQQRQGQIGAQTDRWGRGGKASVGQGPGRERKQEGRGGRKGRPRGQKDGGQETRVHRVSGERVPGSLGARTSETPAEPEESGQCSRPDLGGEQGCWAGGSEARGRSMGIGDQGRPLSHMGP